MNKLERILKKKLWLFLSLCGTFFLLFSLQVPGFALDFKGGDNSMGAMRPSKKWYFAEGTTRSGYFEYLTLLNPSSIQVSARIKYVLDGGDVIVKTLLLQPTSRATINVLSDVPCERDVSAIVEADAPVVVERPMYFEIEGNLRGGHVAHGVEKPETLWYFAEGCTRRGFNTFLCIMNPDTRTSDLSIGYYLGDGSVVERKGVKILPQSRLTIPVHGDFPGVGRADGARGDVSIIVESANGVPVVVERPVYFNYSDSISGGHIGSGVTSPETKWYFAEGCMRPGFDTYLCVFNPNNINASIGLTYFLGNGERIERKNIKIPRQRRVTISVHDDTTGIGRYNDERGDFSTKIESENLVPIVVERPMYFVYRPWWAEGHNVSGTSEPSFKWYFAEGCTHPGFDTYLLIENPSANGTNLDITYYLGDGTVIKRSFAIASYSRLTLPVHDKNVGCGREDGPRGDVGIEISSRSTPVIVERSIYYAERWRTFDKKAIAAARGWGEVSRGNPSSMDVSLTFDIEQDANSVNEMLDILRARNVKATFFILGPFASSHPQVLKRIASEGHEFGNHSISHSQWTKRSADALPGELAQLERQVMDITGLSTIPYFRFPYGDRNASLIALANSCGYLSVYWSVDPQDWRSGRSPQDIVSRVLSSSSPGAIVLLHSGARTRDALPGIIDGLRGRGYRLVTLTELLSN